MSFSENFYWGSASAAYQVEGAYDEDGKGMGIWDALSEGHVKHGENGNVACDHYHRYKEDIAMMKEMGLKAYRFSVSWPRIMPKEGVINQKGIAFYQSLVQELLDAGITPMCTIFHWNLPMWIHEKGGWHYEGISDLFEEYTKILVDSLGDLVPFWMTINEAACFIGNGYVTGEHAPFERGMDHPEELMTIVPKLTRNVMLSHGKAVRTIRKYAPQTVQIGVAFNGSLLIPWEETEESIEDAREATFSSNHFFAGIDWWAGPMIHKKVSPGLEDAISEEDLSIICQPLDFMGYNCYSSNNYDEYTGPNPKVYPGMPRTNMGWPLTPDALYWAVRFYSEHYHLPIMITENGMANVDFVMSDGKVHDPQRIEYLKRYLKGLKRAVDEGYPVLGYLYWSILDNFEWAEGYDKRFGLIYVDYLTQKRTKKDSADWYSEVIRTNGEHL